LPRVYKLGKEVTMLKFDNVSFRYPNQSQNAITDISFEIKKGEFVLLCGDSGCGKTTLLRHAKKNQIPTGHGSGKMYFDGKDIEFMDDRESAALIGYVGQSPDGQIVTDKVWHELAFGLESLSFDRETMYRRIAEMSEYLGISGWYEKKTDELSGGQKQILNLASVMVMHPKILILDEPTSQLDPVASERFLQNIFRLNRDFGVTILICEQRVHEVIHMADRVMLMKDTRVIGFDDVRTIVHQMKEKSSKVYEALPGYMKLWSEYGKMGKLPLTIRDAKLWIEDIKNDIFVKINAHNKISEKEMTDDRECMNNTAVVKNKSEQDGIRPHKKSENDRKTKDVLISAENLSFSYGKNEVLKDFSIVITGGKIYAVMGGNGSGKTTALKILAGIYKKKGGRIKKLKDLRSVYLPQNPQTIFTEISVYDELMEVFKSHRDLYEGAQFVDNNIKEMLEKMELSEKKDSHPFDLSVGQQQRLAIGKVLLLKPDVLMLDEPTKGIDGEFKKKLAVMFDEMKRAGIAVVIVSHDIDFCAENADECGLLFDGELTKMQTAEEFFRQNYFYTTDICRIFSDIYDEQADLYGFVTDDRKSDINRNKIYKKTDVQQTESKRICLPVNYRQAVELFEK